jgi:hypothetical protein
MPEGLINEHDEENPECCRLQEEHGTQRPPQIQCGLLETNQQAPTLLLLCQLRHAQSFALVGPSTTVWCIHTT